MTENLRNEILSYIKSNFTYNDGKLSRKDRKNGLGGIDAYGYKVIKVKGHHFKEHRIVWYLCKGYWPLMELDHINRVRTDNRIENLREVTRQENIVNTTVKINKDTGVKGVYLDRTKGLKAKYTFHFQGKTYRFRNLEDALIKKEELWKGYYGCNRS